MARADPAHPTTTSPPSAATVIVLSAVCVCGPFWLSCPVPDQSQCFCLPTYLGALEIKECRCLHFSARAMQTFASLWFSELLSVCHDDDDDDSSSIVVSLEHVGVETHFHTWLSNRLPLRILNSWAPNVAGDTIMSSGASSFLNAFHTGLLCLFLSPIQHMFIHTDSVLFILHKHYM